MEFKIIQKVRTHNEWDSLKRFLFGILKFILFIFIGIPLLIFLLIFGKRKKSEEKTEEIWNEIVDNGDIKIERKFINENDTPENLDFPEEPSDIYIFKLRTVPPIREVEGKYFDYQYAQSENGAYLISWNTENQGMTLWFLNYKTKQMQIVKNLESEWWKLQDESEKLILSATNDKIDIEIIIEKI